MPGWKIAITPFSSSGCSRSSPTARSESELRISALGRTVGRCATTTVPARSSCSSEVLAERWTLIIVRSLLNGCRTFNEIRQERLETERHCWLQPLEALERAGILVRVVKPDPHAAGCDARAGPRWARRSGRGVRRTRAVGRVRLLVIEPRPTRTRPHILWVTPQLVAITRFPTAPPLLRVPVASSSRQCLLDAAAKATTQLCTGCSRLPRGPVLRISTSRKTLVDLHLRWTTYAAALLRNRLTLLGPPAITRQSSPPGSRPAWSPPMICLFVQSRGQNLSKLPLT